MGVRKTILAILTFFAIYGCGIGKYPDIQIDEEDVRGYVEVYMQLDVNHKDFLIYLKDHNEVDSNEIAFYHDVLYILNAQGFIDMDYFLAVHKKLKPVIDVIRANPNVERYPGIGTADLSFIEEGEEQYRKFLEDTTLTAEGKEFLRKQMAQIETTKVDLFNKKEKNKLWVELVREQSSKETDVVLSDFEIMQLTTLAADISRL